MEIKDGKLVFDDVDIERVCLNRLKQADKYFDENYIEIKGGRANYKDISIDPEAYETTKDYLNIPPYSKRKVLTAENVSKYIAEYLQHLLDDKNTDISILKVLNQLKTEDFSDVLNKETLEKLEMRYLHLNDIFIIHLVIWQVLYHSQLQVETPE